MGCGGSWRGIAEIGGGMGLGRSRDCGGCWIRVNKGWGVELKFQI